MCVFVYVRVFQGVFCNVILCVYFSYRVGVCLYLYYNVCVFVYLCFLKCDDV